MTNTTMLNDLLSEVQYIEKMAEELHPAIDGIVPEAQYAYIDKELEAIGIDADLYWEISAWAIAMKELEGETK